MKHHPLQWLLVPFTLLAYVGTILILPFYRPSRIRLRAGCIEMVDATPHSKKTTIWGRPGGQCWGCRVIWYNTVYHKAKGETTPVHERVHTIHGEWVNVVAHVVLVPLALLVGVHWLWAVLAAQLAFGASYLGHFLIEWARLGFTAKWEQAYVRIWTERIAFRIEREFAEGKRPDAWGA